MTMPTRMINGFNSVKVQIEQNREDLAVPDGIAISNGMYDKDLSYDLPPATVTPMGMNKNGNQTLPNRQWTNITGWVARSGFPGTVINNNGLVVAQTHRANISFKAFFARPGGFAIRCNSQLRILVNGIKVKESDVLFDAIAGGGAVTNAVGLAIDLKQEDIITVQAWTDFFTRDFFAETTILATLQSSSYVTFSQAKLGAVDFMNDLVFASETKFYEGVDRVMVMPNGKLKSLPMNRVTTAGNGNAIAYQAIDVGPIIAQSKIPYPVQPGMLVNFGGTLLVRRSGNREKTEEETTTGLNVRFALWGKGKTSDEYGDNDVDIELMYYESVLQVDEPGNFNDKTVISYTIPSMADIVVPPNVDSVYFVAALKQSVNGEYASASFDNTVRAGLTAAYFGTTYANPLSIKVELPSSEQNTYKHPLSSTGVAMKNRKYFDNVSKPKALTFFGNGSAVSLDIYKSTNKVRGSLIGTFAAAPGERKTVVVESDTGQIELVSSNPFWVESCKAISYDTLNETQTTLERIGWADVSEPLNNIVASRSEFDISKMQLAFVSNDLANSDLLVPGKRVRLLINHYGNSATPTSVYGDTYSPNYSEPSYNVAFTGMIRDYKVKYDYKMRPFIEVTVEDAHRALADTDGLYIYDVPMEYAPMLNGLGHSVCVDDVDVSGKWKNKTDSPKNQPSAFVDGMKVEASLEAMRNSTKGFIYVDKSNCVQYKTSISSDPKMILGDSFYRSDISYSRLDKGTDTEAVINQVKPTEYRLDLEELKDRSVDSELPADIQPIQSIREVSQWWYDQASIRSYGAREATFPVVRGTGRMEDIRTEELGPGFHDWADAIMDDYVLAKNRVSRVMIIPDNFYDLKRLSELEIFDAIKILWKNEQHLCFIRKMEWTIVDNHIRLELYFSRESSGVAWTPNVELAEGYTDLYFDIY